MRWVAKALAEKAVSGLPHGERLNYTLGRHVLRSLPAGEATFRRKVARAAQHFDAFLRLGPGRSASEAVFYEFGAGRDLTIPLAYHALGVERQILVDIRPNLRPELVGDVISKFAAHADVLAEEVGRPLRTLGPPRHEGARELEARFGITYLAPQDARHTGLPTGSVDFVSSTNTMEHIPETDLLRILEECRRLLRPDSLLSSRIDLEDHYARFDRSISRYNFLRFSERRWRMANSSLHYQNRLRYPDYLELVRRAGFQLVEERLSRPTDADLDTLRSLDVAERFRRYSVEDLGVRGLVIVARA